jgi:hypothetical protein
MAGRPEELRAQRLIRQYERASKIHVSLETPVDMYGESYPMIAVRDRARLERRGGGKPGWAMG